MNNGPELRAAVLDELRKGLGWAADMPEFADKLIGPLARGEAVTIDRYDLPDWCPERHVGRPGDTLLSRLTTESRMSESAGAPRTDSTQAGSRSSALTFSN